jgi:uncharacterized damage-inducible protein DinB
MDLLDRLLEHDRWATTSLLDLCAPLPDDQLDREFDIGHRTIRQTFMHAIYNVAAWTLRMEERSFDPDLPENRSIPALLAWHERSWDTFAIFARRIRDEQRMDDTFTDVIDGQTGEMTYGGAILHVILHNEGHRTEAVHMLSRLDIPEVPEIDHGLWDYVRRGL